MMRMMRMMRTMRVVRRNSRKIQTHQKMKVKMMMMMMMKTSFICLRRNCDKQWMMQTSLRKKVHWWLSTRMVYQLARWFAHQKGRKRKTRRRLLSGNQ